MDIMERFQRLQELQEELEAHENTRLQDGDSIYDELIVPCDCGKPVRHVEMMLIEDMTSNVLGHNLPNSHALSVSVLSVALSTYIDQLAKRGMLEGAKAKFDAVWDKMVAHHTKRHSLRIQMEEVQRGLSFGEEARGPSES